MINDSITASSRGLGMSCDLSLAGRERKIGKVKGRIDTPVKIMTMHQHILCELQEIQEIEKQVNNTRRKPSAKFRMWNILQDK